MQTVTNRREEIGGRYISLLTVSYAPWAWNGRQKSKDRVVAIDKLRCPPGLVDLRAYKEWLGDAITQLYIYYNMLTYRI